MVDRASTFADEETLGLLRKGFISFAPSVTEILKSRDPAGEFFRKVANQRAEPRHTKQGYYICAPDGTLLKGWMYPRPDDGTMKRNLKETMEKYQAPKDVAAIDAGKPDRFAPQPPAGAAVAEVYTKLLEANWQKTNVQRLEMIRGAIGRERIWITKAEIGELAKNTLPDSLLERMIRFHFVDNTRGVPAAWAPADLKGVSIKTTPDKGRMKIEGSVRLDAEGRRRYDAKLEGFIEVKGETLTRFDLVAQGVLFASKAEIGEIPIGDTTFAVAFTIATDEESKRVPPLFTIVGDYLGSNGRRVSELRNTATK
jgi:hypothetical protein